MLGLPSTTEVNKRIPKEAFYRHLTLNTKTKDEFVSGIERIVIVNSIKPTTANIEDGQEVHEILVLAIALKTPDIPKRVLEQVASANPHKLLFACVSEDETTLVTFFHGMQAKHNVETITLTGTNLDEAWSAFVSQVVYDEIITCGLDARIRHDRRVQELEAEVKALETKCLKSKQLNKRNLLFEQKKIKQAELDALRKGN